MASSEEKRWAKEARQRRQALKKAAPPPPNLFQARIRRQEGLHYVPSRAPLWALLALLVLAGGWWWMTRRPSLPWKAPTSLPPAALAPAEAPPRDAPVLSSTVVASTPTVAVSVAPVRAAPDAISALQASATAEAAAPTPRVVVPDTREWQGPASLIKDKRTVIVRGRAQWRALWTEMGRTEEPPRINFYDYMVIGVFAGPKNDPAAEVQMMDSRESNEDLVVSYRDIDAPAASAAVEPIFPYHLRIIPRTAKTIRFVKT